MAEKQGFTSAILAAFVFMGLFTRPIFAAKRERRLSIKKIAKIPLFLMLLPLLAHAKPGKEIFIQYAVSFCSEYTLVETEDPPENQRVCITALKNGGNSFRVTANRECQSGSGNCPVGPFGRNRSWCNVSGEGPSDIIQVGNKNHFVVDLQPEECDPASTIGTPQGAQLIADTNGIFESTTSRKWSSARSAELHQQCFSRTDGGTKEDRSADIIATIDGWELVIGDVISTFHEFGFHSNCSN